MMSYRTWGRGLCLLVALAALPVIGQEPREEGTEAGRDEGAKQERPEKPDDQTGTPTDKEKDEPEAAPPAPPTPPEWAYDACWYYCLVSRFHNGSTQNDPAGTRPWTQAWPSMADMKTDEERKALNDRSYGGDLIGLQAKLPYLKALGFNALCLTPIFAADGDDKYHTTDFRHVDDSFGVKGSMGKLVGEQAIPGTWDLTASDRLFLGFLQKAHESGFKVIVDGAFVSVSTNHWAWKDVVRRGKDSPYADWFQVIDFGPPLKWNGPKGQNGDRINFSRSKSGLAPLLENHLFAIVKRWMDPNGDGDPSDGVDGWRFSDVAEVDKGFWQRINGIVKRMNPQALIVGELWQSPEDWLGDYFDAVLNYGAGGAIRRYFARDGGDFSTSRFMADLAAMRKPLHLNTNLAMLNVVGSHDTERILTRLSRKKPQETPDRADPKPDDPKSKDSGQQKGEDKPAGTAASKSGGDSEPSTEGDLDRWRLMAAFRAFYIGAPMTYYGEEVGMTGSSSELARAPMWWLANDPSAASPKEYRPSFLELTKLLHTIRRVHEPLRRGDCKTILADDEKRLIAFKRTIPGSEIIVLLNCSQKKQRVQLKVAKKPGEMVGVLTPQLKPASPKSPQLRLLGSRHIVTKTGTIDLPVDPMSVRLVLVKDATGKE